MRKSDQGYANHAAYKGCTVLLDGVEVKRVFMADEERGEIIRAAADANGRIHLDGDEVAQELLRGNVRVIKP